MSYIVKDIGDQAVLGFLLKKDGVGVTGQTPTIEIRRHSDGSYLNFAGPPYWVNAGGQQYQILAPAAWQDGYYFWIYDDGVYGDGNAHDYSIMYRNPSPYETVEIEIMGFGQEGAASLPPHLWQWCDDLIELTGDNTIAVGNVFPEICESMPPPCTI